MIRAAFPVCAILFSALSLSLLLPGCAQFIGLQRFEDESDSNASTGGTVGAGTGGEPGNTGGGASVGGSPDGVGGTTGGTGGTGGDMCGAGTSLCGTTCVDTSSNASHCGTCGTACGMGDACYDSECGPFMCGAPGMNLVQNSYLNSGTFCGHLFSYVWHGDEEVPLAIIEDDLDGPYACAEGSVPADHTEGAALGLNLRQPISGGAELPWEVQGDGLAVQISGVDVPATLRVALKVEGQPVDDPFCFVLPVGIDEVTIPWASFSTRCWPGGNGVLFDGVTPINTIDITVPGDDSSAQTFNFCLEDIDVF